MSTKKETHQEQKINYDPKSLSTYQSLQGPLGDLISSQLTGGLINGTFLARQQLANKQALNLGNRMKTNLLTGYSGGNMDAYKAAQLAKVNRSVSGIQGNSFMQNLLQRAQEQQYYAGLGSQYRPLQTGQTSDSVEKTSGTGTWLPQLLGAGLQAGMMFATGGMSGAAGAAGGAGKAASYMASPSSLFSGFQSSFNPFLGMK